MPSEPGATSFIRIDEAFRRGDLAALRAAVGDASLVPNGQLPHGIGSCLVTAIYRSPLAFIRDLLAIGADPNAPADDGFPPLIAALSCTRQAPGSVPREDVPEIVRLLLQAGADPNQRGINDYTPLHMAVAERNLFAAYRLLEGGADPKLATRIDDYDTPIEMAAAARLDTFVELLESGGRPSPRRMRSGLKLLVDIPGQGAVVRRQEHYLVSLRMWLDSGERVRDFVTGDDATTAEILVNRGRIIAGLFYGVEGMCVGGMRRLAIAPFLAYGERGVPGSIPANAGLEVEVTVIRGRRSQKEDLWI